MAKTLTKALPYILMDLKVLPIHKHPQYLEACCELLNDEWRRSYAARCHSLRMSCDDLPTSLILIQNKHLIGHAKLSKIPAIPQACFVESVVIDRKLRGKGYGSFLMVQVENYCKEKLRLREVYLSTKGQEKFYKKLGYQVCGPISIYGSYVPKFNVNENGFKSVTCSGPPPPPLPGYDKIQINTKTYMKKCI